MIFLAAIIFVLIYVGVFFNRRTRFNTWFSVPVDLLLTVTGQNALVAYALGVGIVWLLFVIL